MDAMIQVEEVENVRIEDLVEDYLDTKDKVFYEGQSISNETFLITQVCNDW